MPCRSRHPFFLFNFAWHGKLYKTVQVGSAWVRYFSSDKYTYEGSFSIAFHSICKSTKLPDFFFHLFSPMSGLPRRHIACTRPLTFEAVIPSHFVFPVHFDHLYAVSPVKENDSYKLLIGSFI